MTLHVLALVIPLRPAAGTIPVASLAGAGSALAVAGAGVSAVIARRRRQGHLPATDELPAPDTGHRSGPELDAPSERTELPLLADVVGVDGLLGDAPADAAEWPRLELRGVDGAAALDGLDLRGADLTRARLAGAPLSGCALTGARLERADLDGAELDGAVLVGADLTWASLHGADLRGADCTGARFVEADLGRADLRGTVLTGARGLAGANLRGARADKTTVWPEGFRPQLAGVSIVDRPGGR